MSAVGRDISARGNESSHSAVSWAAIFAGAAVASALSLLLLTLGTGLGLSTISPWDNDNTSPTSFGIGAIAWLILTQLISAGVGGYVAGRLRTKWANLHGDEVFFRDTAHGFLVWCVGTLIAASVVGSAATATVRGVASAGKEMVSAGAGVAAAGVEQAKSNGNSQYMLDKLLRRAKPDSASKAGGRDPRQELGPIFEAGLKDGKLNDDDRTYAARVVAEQAGITQAEAEKRVDESVAKVKQTVDQAKEAADKARKAAAIASLMMALSLLMGAFVASYAATIGGRQRDLY